MTGQGANANQNTGEPRTLFSDGYDTTVVLDCGHMVRLSSIPGLPDPQPGEWRSCAVHSAVYGYDPKYGDALYERDRRVAEVRREL